MQNSNVAGVKLPLRVWIEGVMAGLKKGEVKGFTEVVIVSEKIGASGKGKEKAAAETSI